jgi:Right handed beta helix region
MEERVKGPRNLLLAVMFVILAAGFSTAATRYVAQSAGTFAGGTACNGQTAITPATFNSTALSPGDVAYICGTITGAAGVSGLIQPKNGGSSSNPVQIIFDTDAVLTAPYWGLSGAIYASGINYLTVDGGTNGLITASANGTGQAHSVSNTFGTYFSGVSNLIVQNLTITNVYVHRASPNDENGFGAYSLYAIGGSNITFQNNTIHDAFAGPVYVYPGSATSSNININHNTIYNCNWSLEVGSGAPNAILNNVQIDHNTMYGWDNWSDTANDFHHDGVFVFTQAAGDQVNTLSVTNTLAGSPTTTMTAEIFVVDHQAGTDVIQNALIANNIVYNSSGNAGCPADGYITDWATGSYVFNNTIAAAKPGTCSGSGGIGNNGFTEYGTKSTLRNNVIVNCFVGLVVNTGSSISSSDYNDVYNCSDVGDYAGTFYGSLANWQTAKGFSTHSIAANPNLNGSYAPNAGSPVIGLGANLTSYCTTYPVLCYDYNGTKRPSSGAWDAGAYSYNTSQQPPPPSGLAAAVH